MQRWEPFRELEELHERALSVLDGAIADGGAVPWVPVADIEETEDAWLGRRTRPVGRFELRVRVPGTLDADRVEAKLHDGVLTLHIPKAAESQPKRIEIQSES
jgi:HSP20 family protein